MEKEILNEPIDFVEELLELIRGAWTKEELLEKLSDYHDNDIAGALEQLTPEERKILYPILGAERVSDIFSYLEDPEVYIQELNLEKAAKVLSEMDADDAVDVLAEMEDDVQEQIVELMDDESSKDVKLILSYDEDEVGSYMTTNFILIKRNLSVREAMNSLIEQAGDNDNISTIYVEDEDNRFYGAIDLKDLIIARKYEELENLIVTSYPFVSDHEKLTDSLERMKEYAEDSIPVVNEDGKVLGIITSTDLVEAVDEEMSEDYAKLAGLSEEADIKESTFVSMKKRLPWLVILMFLGLGVSTVVGAFEGVVAAIPLIICFQSLILDMAGNVGTQSLAVTIRVLMDENLSGSQKAKLVGKELKIGGTNGLILGTVSLLWIGVYLVAFKGQPVGQAFLLSMCVGIALLLAMVASSLIGTLVPMFFHKIKIDPAVASGPLITTVNDLVAVVTYYGLAYLMLIKLL